jgi:hypothetical protein
MDFVCDIDVIKDYYPNTFQWMKDKANWEHMSLSAILRNYPNQIQKLVAQEEEERE